MRSVKDFVALAKANPGKLTHGSSGTGGSLHLGAELFKQSAAVNMVHIPYKGAALALTDVIGGHVDSMFISAPGAIGQIKAGKVRGIAVTTIRRSQLVPNLPTLSEAGLKGFDANNWYGLLAPAKTPQPIIDRVNAETTKILGMPDIKNLLFNQGLDVAPGTPEQFAAYIKSERVKWAKVVKASGAKAN